MVKTVRQMKAAAKAASRLRPKATKRNVASAKGQASIPPQKARRVRFQ
jgi:hypothetical protein